MVCGRQAAAWQCVVLCCVCVCEMEMGGRVRGGVWLCPGPVVAVDDVTWQSCAERSHTLSCNFGKVLLKCGRARARRSFFVTNFGIKQIN